MNLPQKRFVVIRHGQTNANRDALIAGRIEAQLTQEGRRSAAELSGWQWPKDMMLFASPQQRAQDTASLAFPKATIITLDGLRERDWGVYEGRPVSEAPKRDETPEDGEAWADMIARVGTEITRAQSRVNKGLSVFVAHSGVIRAVRELTGGNAHGPSPANTTPYLYTPTPDGWVETCLKKGNAL
ncbi:histidine phosphatase family protein [Lentibacter algarum]|uniref:histidine phosphatase family protein n=1 Tax=Lentibacter algarum TaxID=576131 RepID=UPI001C06F2FB|nr:histidine phosphatase family protein [Lentibacter algarum]MBU2980609.1 histidine phosphatase family protein [Lentibacter algarum]